MAGILQTHSGKIVSDPVFPSRLVESFGPILDPRSDLTVGANMKNIARVGLVLALVSGAAFAQSPTTGRALNLEDYYRIKTVEAPQISPDGKWVSFTVSAKIED